MKKARTSYSVVISSTDFHFSWTVRFDKSSFLTLPPSSNCGHWHSDPATDFVEMPQMIENKKVDKPLSVRSNLTELADQYLDRFVWYRLSEPSLLRLWDND